MGKIKGLARATRAGFTLIEMITVSGLMALFSLTIISVFLATLRGGNKAQLTQRVHQDGDYALNTMAATIRNSTVVVCGSTIAVTMPEGTIIRFSAVENNGVTRVASDSSRFLTGIITDVSDFSASCVAGYLGNQVVTLQFTLTAVAPAQAQAQEQLIQDFATSVSTRQQ